MSIWSDDIISSVAAEAELEVANELKCITKRVALNIRAHESLYSVPDDCITIRRVTWQGKKLEPKHFRGILRYPVVDPAGVIGAFYNTAFDNAFFINASDSKPESGSPYLYFYSGFGENVIKLFPTPSNNLPNVSGADSWDSILNIDALTSIDQISGQTTSNLFAAGIAAYCIVEYYTFPDLTGNIYRLPSYIARRIIKAFTLSKLLAIEGPGQDLTGAARHQARYFKLLSDFKKIYSGTFVSRVQTRSPNGGLYPTTMSRPRLPSNFGTFTED